MGANASAVNLFSTVNSLDQWFPIWKTTRVMKAAGWIYKGSSDGTGASGNKETAGAFLQDKWGPGGVASGHTLFDAQFGTAAIIGTITNNRVTITGLSGMTSISVGRGLSLSGAINASNNGTFTIVAFNSSTSVDIHNPLVVSEATSLTWSERVSGSASITWSSVTDNREQTITGLSGITPGSASCYIYLTDSANSNNNGVFQILKYVSFTSVVIINSAGASDTATGTWTLLDPLLDAYPPQANLTFGSWTVYQGPSTLKIPINATSVGNFTVGENITQSGSGAQGELVGYQYDTASAQGYLVVMPRQNGSESGVLGWSTVASTITGSTSGATVTTASISTPIEYVRESVFWKSTAVHNNGSIYHCVVDGYAESTNRFSSLLGAAGVTNVVAPGGGGTGNGFPSIGACAVKGTAAVNTGLAWLGSSAVLGKMSVFAANASYTTNVSADGTWTTIAGFQTGTANTSSGSFVGMGFWRLDNTEPGDIDPYVWFMPTLVANYAENRLGPAGSATSGEHFAISTALNSTWLKGWRRRGFTTNDMVQQFQFAGLDPTLNAVNSFLYIFNANYDFQATSLSSTPPVIKEPLWVVSTQVAVGVAGQAFGKMRKGSLRWGFLVPSGQCSKRSYDNRMYVALTNTNGVFMLGPWDGVSPLYQV